MYEAARRGLLKTAVRPLTLTFSVTAACQSRCKTCNIGKVYLANPKIAERDLALDEIEKTFQSLGPIYFLNFSGGEPFMRSDLPEIIRLACLHLGPRLIHISTNALLPERIEKATQAILGYMDRYLSARTPLTIKPSIDGVGAMHDDIRGVKGNFALLERTIDLLLRIRSENPRLHVDLGTVVSNYNVDDLDVIEDWVHSRGIESYRHEIAEQRAEFHNLGDPITPSADTYAVVIERFKKKILENIGKKRIVTRMTEAVRLVYYDVAVRILKQQRQITPCYAGISNIHLNYDGEVWPCCVLGGRRTFGNIRDLQYDLWKLLCGEQARKAREYIAGGNCACPMANQWLSNILLTPRHAIKVLYTLFLLARRFEKS